MQQVLEEAAARLNGGVLILTVEALAPDGSARWRRQFTHDMSAELDPESTAAALGLELGQQIRDEAGDAIVLKA